MIPICIDGFLNLMSSEGKLGLGKDLFWFHQSLKKKKKKLPKNLNASLDDEGAELIHLSHI